jgi:RND family efflux transporter MFP subunit
MKYQRTALAVVAVGGLSGAGYLARPAGPTVPSVEVARGEFVDAVQIRGEIKAGKSITLTAPSDAGDLRIVKLARNGVTVKKGDVVVEFDGSTVARTLEQKQSELKGLEAEIEKARVQARIKEEEDITAQTKARYDVERAKLDYSAREILSRVEGEQRRLAVLDAQEKLRDATAKLEGDRLGGRADLAVATQKRDKARFDVGKAQRQLHALAIVAPSDGIVTIMPNFRSGGWGNRQEFKEGDRAWPGAAIAELPDVSSTFASAKIDEIERGRLSTSQQATIRIEALPDRELKGSIKSISSIAKADFSSWPPPRSFDLIVALDEVDPRLRPGMTATIRVAVDRIAGALVVPAEAVFSDRGEDVVYVLQRGRAVRRPIAVDRRNTEQVVVGGGIVEGERIALRKPGGPGSEARQ